MTHAILAETSPAVTSAVVRSAVEAEVLKQLRSLRFGQLTVQIHDARIVQIERTEKFRTDHRAVDGQRG
jgi:hypothetical protein